MELIYSRERNLLEQFAREADASGGSNGHSAASGRIMDGFAQKLGLVHSEIEKLPLGQVQAVARTLFDESDRALTPRRV